MKNYLLIFLFFIPVILYGERISYVVNFDGLEDEHALEEIKAISQLVALRKKKPPSLNALRFRAESDFPALLKVLQNHGYLEAQIQFHYQEHNSHHIVNMEITPGPRYQIDQFEILETSTNQNLSKDFGMELKGPLIAQKILDADKQLLQRLKETAYPFASIQKREIIADGETKKAKVLIETKKGPRSFFGPTTLQGLKNVHPKFVEQKVDWKENQLYSSKIVKDVQDSLMDSGLFSSVYITHPETADENQNLPMKIEVAETKHKSISVGATYQMTVGPGLSFGWENRNLGGMGKTLSLSLDIAQNNQSGTASLGLPNFLGDGQDFTIQAEVAGDEVTAYQDRTYHLLFRLDRELTDASQISLGIKPERLIVKESAQNGRYVLLQTPFSFNYSTSDNALHPTKGTSIKYTATPCLNFKNTVTGYLHQSFSHCSYIPLFKEDALILAQKVTLESILSPSLRSIPLPKRILGSSADSLRGYRYQTVSPLKNGRPLGGRSAIYYSLEPRFRVSESIGIVPFFDLGCVFAAPVPDFKEKWLKSLGIGLRYFSFLGPLRLDFAFPLDRRVNLDPKWWVFASLGQSF